MMTLRQYHGDAARCAELCGGVSTYCILYTEDWEYTVGRPPLIRYVPRHAETAWRASESDVGSALRKDFMGKYEGYPSGFAGSQKM